MIIEDDAALNALISFDLQRRGYNVHSAKSGEEGCGKLNTDPSVVITDLKLGDMDGLDVLKKVKAHNPATEVLVMTGHGSIDTAVTAMKAGAFDYLTKPVDSEELSIVIDKALDRRKMLQEIEQLREDVRDKYSLSGIVYAGPKIKKVLDLVGKVAKTEATVLILGESGTGKELIARAIHEQSTRRHGAFIAINCGALPEGLLESELFGHIKGSFTGADRNKRGLFEEACEGTLFLDEISETTPALQVKLLRALQEGEIRRVGDNHPIKVSGRLVTATNKDLAKLIAAGKFREDLYYRLKVFPIELPPLRERKEDIVPLCEYFLHKAHKKINGKAHRFSPAAAQSLTAYPWPGNVRELEHAIERMLILSSNAEISIEDIPADIRSASLNESPMNATQPESLNSLEKRHIFATLDFHSGNQEKAAATLGITRAALSRKLKSWKM